MKFLGLELVPLSIPFERRLQTLAVLSFISSVLFFTLLGYAILILILFTPYYYLSIIYLTWFYHDRNVAVEGGRTLQWVRKAKIFRYFAGFYPIKLIKTAELDPSKNYICGFHPHGIGAHGCLGNFGTEGTGFSNIFPGIKSHFLTLDGNFNFPLYRELFLSMGGCSVSKESIDWLLTKEGLGNFVVIVVGGAAEALDARPGEATLTLRRRKGFVRMAMMHGASLVPIYSFGENDVFDQVPNPPGSLLRAIQDKMSKVIGFSLPLFHGRGVFNYTFGYLPHRRPINTVVGAPIDLKRNERPSAEEVDKVHTEYLERLKELYDKYKVKYGDPKQELVFK